jgi:ribosomal protein S12 methylthiotransferase
MPDMSTCKKVSLIVYGCAKNHIDAEEMGARLSSAGYILTSRAEDSNIIVVHTCGFILDAKKESIDGVFKACQLGVPVLVTGCLSQRYPDELLSEIPEIQGVGGTAAPKDIVALVENVLEGKRVKSVAQPGRGCPGRWDLRLLEQRAVWAYVRVSEGCRHHCTYCAIPGIRGPLVSRPMEDIRREVEELSRRGVKEINLIAQDLSDYGVDLYGKRALPNLLHELSDIKSSLWIRLLYLRPNGITPELSSAMKLPAVVPYVDLPIEHGSQRILRRMGRPGKADVIRAVSLLRSEVPNIAMRTTIIAGFPGEAREDLEETIELINDLRFVRVAAFPFSREEGTPAYLLKDTVSDDNKRMRAELVRRKGLELARNHSQSLVGKEIPVLLTRQSMRPGYHLGRGEHQAPEVDGRVFVRTKGTRFQSGDIIMAKVVRAGTLDIFARPVDT